MINPHIIKLTSTLVLVSSFILSNAQLFEQIGPGFGPSSGVRCMYFDQQDNLLYLGGSFHIDFNGNAMPYVAIWDGTNLNPWGCGFNWACNPDDEPEPSMGCFDIIKCQDTLYAAFSSGYSGTNQINSIAKWTGSEWLPVGIITNVSKLVAINDTLFACGGFQITDENIDGLAWWCVSENKWKAFHNLPNMWTGGSLNDIDDIALYNNEYYVGGNFNNINTGVADLVKWTGSDWVPVDGLCGGLDGVTDLDIFQGKLIVAGTYFQGDCAGNPGNYIAAYDGENWTSLGSGMNSQINDILATESYLYASGSYSTAGGVNTELLARWDGEQWCGYGWSEGDYYFDEPFIRSIGIMNGQLLAGGSFVTVNNQPMRQLIKYIGPDSCILSDINEIPEFEIGIFPNPTSDFISIQGIPKSAHFRVIVTDLSGRIIKSESNKSKIDISELSSGIYLVALEFDQGRMVKRVVKE
jgi:trimeric autotransporter adhesin